MFQWSKKWTKSLWWAFPLREKMSRIEIWHMFWRLKRNVLSFYRSKLQNHFRPSLLLSSLNCFRWVQFILDGYKSFWTGPNYKNQSKSILYLAKTVQNDLYPSKTISTFKGTRQKFEIRPTLKALQNSSQLSTYSANKLDTKVKLKFFARKWNEELCSYMEIRNFFFLEF